MIRKILIFGFIFALINGAHANDSSAGYISAQSGGQLGNQMFHFSAAYVYALDHNLTAVFPILNESHNNLSYNRDHIFFRLSSLKPNPPLVEYHVEKPNYEKLPDDLVNVELVGGLFSWKFFDHRRADIQALFQPKKSTLEYLHGKYGQLIAEQDTVAVHVRTYSKVIHDEGLHFVGLKYFAKTFENFSKNATYVVFSDRINWCKVNFAKHFPELKFVYIEGNDHVEDLILMSLMKHQILSKSTFSWWGAYLNQNPTKSVYCPVKKSAPIPNIIKSMGKIILAGFGKYFWSNEEYYLPSWQIEEYEVEEYPKDIYDYGGESTSVEALDK